ncbi:MBL fold metallo-hydrolase [Heyndrickxia sporothermodurans]|nr:MBL fold metallo-hydrolase [Heyndrickxia sporothermodurans]
MKIIDIDDRIKLIDLFDLKEIARTGSFILLEDEITVIETSASPSIPYLKAGLETLNIKLEEIKYIILTHIHLDHGGGVGLFLKECPNAKIIVHPKGARHLIDPSRLENGAREVYKEQFDSLFHPIIPISEERIIIKNNGDTLKIGSNTILSFYHTPGHANHHFSIYDPVSNGIFTGDTAGIYYWMLKDENIDFFLPSTSPNQFNPDAMIQSINFFRKKSLNRLYFGHFGFTHKVGLAIDTVEKWLKLFVEYSKKAYLSCNSNDQRIEMTYNYLYQTVFNHLSSQGVPNNHSIYQVLKLDLNVSSMGLIDYWNKKYTI